MSGDHNMYASGSGDGQKSGWRKRTIMEMAREADPKANLSETYCLNPETKAWLERFAALVREDERDRVLKILDDQGTWAHTGDLIELVKEST